MLIQKDFPLSQILWYKTGGKAQYLLEANNAEDIKEALDFIEQNKIQKVFVVGLGSNLFFSDDYFSGAVIRIVGNNKTSPLLLEKNGLIKVFAGEILDHVIQYSLDHHLIGLEWAGGLPGTVGGGIRGNAGAFGKEVSENLVSAEILERNDTQYLLKTYNKADLHFSYRNSLVKKNKNLIIVSATFKLEPATLQSLSEAKNIYENNIAYRKKHHSLEYRSCGSVFKNITDKDQVEKIISVWPETKELIETKWHGKVSMGFMIGKLGFSRYRIGNMQVSPRHNNFIVNLGEGKASDVLTIIREIQNKVHEAFGFTPEVEVEIVDGSK